MQESSREGATTSRLAAGSVVGQGRVATRCGHPTGAVTVPRPCIPVEPAATVVHCASASAHVEQGPNKPRAGAGCAAGPLAGVKVVERERMGREDKPAAVARAAAARAEETSGGGRRWLRRAIGLAVEGGHRRGVGEDEPRMLRAEEGGDANEDVAGQGRRLLTTAAAPPRRLRR
jgi:hypothetical protein